MKIFSKLHRNKVGVFSDSRRTGNHKKMCGCRQCRKERKKEIKVSCAFLMPLFGIIAIISAIA